MTETVFCNTNVGPPGRWSGQQHRHPSKPGMIAQKYRGLVVTLNVGDYILRWQGSGDAECQLRMNGLENPMMREPLMQQFGICWMSPPLRGR